MRKKGDLSNFERGMVAGARQAGLSISQSAQLLGFSQTNISRVYREWCEKEKHPVCVSPVGKNALLMLEVRGQRNLLSKLNDFTVKFRYPLPLVPAALEQGTMNTWLCLSGFPTIQLYSNPSLMMCSKTCSNATSSFILTTFFFFFRLPKNPCPTRG